VLNPLLKDFHSSPQKESVRAFLFQKPKTGEAHPVTTVRSVCAMALKRTGITDFRFHNSRHMFAVRLLEAVQKLTRKISNKDVFEKDLAHICHIDGKSQIESSVSSSNAVN